MRFSLRAEKIGYALVVDGPTLGHIRPDGDTWRWELKTPISVEGTADDIEDAQQKLCGQYFREMQKLSR